jgi:hypothetical protein
MILAVESALEKLMVMPQDVAAIALVRRYAADVDEAELVSVTADKLLREVQGYLDPGVYDRIKALFARIERTQVLATLGPKLLVAMTELGMTPKSRADTTFRGGVAGGNGPDGAGPGQPPQSALARQRAARATRLARQSGGEHAS